MKKMSLKDRIILLIAQILVYGSVGAAVFSIAFWLMIFMLWVAK